MYTVPELQTKKITLQIEAAEIAAIQYKIFILLATLVSAGFIVVIWKLYRVAYLFRLRQAS